MYQAVIGSYSMTKMGHWKEVLKCVSKVTKYPSVCEKLMNRSVGGYGTAAYRKNICQIVVTVLTLFVCSFVCLWPSVELFLYINSSHFTLKVN